MFPEVSGSVGRFGYSFIGSVGSVNFAEPAVTRTRPPSNVNETGLLGRFFEISERRRPGTRTLPASFTSALNEDLAEVSRSDAERVTSFWASITIPSRAVMMGRVERLRETQLTESVNTALSTVNFIYLSLSFSSSGYFVIGFFWIVDWVRAQTFLYL